ncbi:MAG: hypothetical protein MUO40_11520 [Anaerolineaceae bacterium]|nr:hypothetical protein [Anaerolineaceae bacterium]
MINKKKKEYILYGFTILLFLLIWLELKLLGFNFMQSDVQGYWIDSLNWETPFHPHHVPLYPLLIAGFRGITFNIFRPLVYMIGITIACLILAIISIKKISLTILPNSVIYLIPILLLVIWPLAGIYAVVYPLDDYVAISIFLFGLLLFIKNKPAFGSIVWGLAMITHKAIWPFVGLSYLVWSVIELQQVKIKWLFHSFLLLLPLVSLWIGGAAYYSNWKWILSSNLGEIYNHEMLIPFRGIINAFLLGDPASILKGSVMVFLLLLTVGIMVVLIKNKPVHFLYGLSITIAVLLMAMMLSEMLTWGFVRFSRLLVIPILLIISDLRQKGKIQITKPLQKWLIVIAIILMTLSQFVFVYYMARIYFI